MQELKNSASDTVKFFKSLATNHLQLWTETTNTFNQLKGFVFNIQSELKNIYRNMNGISTEDKVQMACMISGGLVQIAAQSLLTGGAALTRALPLLMLKLKSVTDLLAKIAALEKRGILFKNKDLLTREVMSCVRD